MEKLVVFYIDEQQFALNIERVERIISIVEILQLPKAPDYIAGTINYYGEHLPVINMRKLFLLPLRKIELTDQIIIVKTDRMKIALWVDRTNEIVTLNNEQIIPNNSVFLEAEMVEGLFKLNDGRVLISNPDKFLKPEQIEKLSILLSKLK